MNILKILSLSYYLGMILLIAGILLQLNNVNYGLYLLVAGIIPFLGIRLFNLINGKPENKRLNGIMVASALFLTATIAAIVLNKNYWIIGILITAVLDLYVSFRKYA